MDINDLRPALGELQVAVEGVSDALIPYYEGEVAVAQAEDQLERATERYERTSAEVARIIIAQLATESAGVLVFDDDAVSRLAISIAIDAKVAEQAAQLLEMEPQFLDGDQLRRLGPAAHDDLGTDVRADCEPLIAELGRASGAESQPGPPGNPGTDASGLTITDHVDRILDLASDDMVGTLSKLVSWQQQTLALIKEISEAAGPWLKDLLPQLGRGWSALRMLLAKAWRLVISKVSVLIRGHGKELLETLDANPFELLGQLARKGRIEVIGRLLGAAKVIGDIDKLFGPPTSPQKAQAALRACDDVVEHHKSRRCAVPWLNRALPACSLVSLSGFPLKTVAAVTLLIYSLWTAHDHLDSPRLKDLRLPKNPGLQRTVEAALRS